MSGSDAATSMLTTATCHEIGNSSKMAPRHLCKLCERTFSTAATLRKHCIKQHASGFPRRPEPRPPSSPSSAVSTGFSYKCGICNTDIGSGSFLKFEEHLKKNHDIKVESEVFEFNCKEDFEIWKKSVEKRSHFVKYRKDYFMESSNAIKSYFRCNRTGTFKGETSPTKRKRHLKSQGSSKIGAHCPASIRATTYKNGKISVTFIKTHVGHDFELAHIPLPVEDKKQLASKIAQKIPFDTIIDDLHASVGDELERKHLVTKEDLRNIIKEYSLDKECVRHPDDTLSIEAWVEKMKGSENNCIILYKPCGIMSPDLPQLKKEDFMLGIMTKAHSEKLKKYGGDFICIASNHGTIAYKFEMSTILVLDDLRQGFPCAFYFSNRNDNLGFELFLNNVRNRIGRINTRTLMTDMSGFIYNSWQNVMGLVEQRLYSTWHVQREWQKRIKSFKNKTKKEEVSKKLFSLHFEEDERTFEMTLSATINYLKSDTDTFTFSKYFEEHFLKNPQLWAYCYRKNVGFNTNMHLERLYSIFKNLYWKGKMAKKLDVTVHALMRLIERRLFDRLIIMPKGKVTSIIENTRDCHTESLSLSLDQTEDDSDDEQLSIISQKSTDIDNSNSNEAVEKEFIASAAKKPKLDNDEVEAGIRELQNCFDDLLNQCRGNKELIDSLKNYLKTWDPKCILKK